MCRAKSPFKIYDPIFLSSTEIIFQANGWQITIGNNSSESLTEPGAINKSHFHHSLIAVRAKEAEGSLTTSNRLRSCAWKRPFYRFSRKPLHWPLVSHHHWQWTAPNWAKNVSAIQRHGGSKQKTEWNYRFLTIFMFPSPLDVYTNKMDFLRPP